MDQVTQFIERVVNRIKSQNIFDLIVKDLETDKGTWDEVARKKIGIIVKEAFKETFPNEDIKAVYVEGEGTSEWEKPPYHLFGSRGVYPDIGILRPKKIAIELDHSEKGRTETPGSKFKMALAKASFACISEDWDYCFVLFHNQSGKPMKSFLDRETESKILKVYEEQFYTQVILFPDR
jgi:hypothetical protein